MNKINGKAFRVLIATILLTTILMLICAGCKVVESTESNERFTIEYIGDGVTIITDTDTAVQYLFYKYGYGGGLTVLRSGEGG